MIGVFWLTSIYCGLWTTLKSSSSLLTPPSCSAKLIFANAMLRKKKKKKNHGVYQPERRIIRNMWTPEAKLNFVSQSMCEKKKFKRCHLHIKTGWNQLKIVVFPSCRIKLQLFQAEHCLISTSRFRTLWTARIKCVNACDPCQRLSCFVSLPLKQRTWNCTVSARKQETKSHWAPPPWLSRVCYGP